MVLMSTKSQDLREAIRSKAAITFRGWTVRRTAANAASRSLGALGQDCLERASLAHFGLNESAARLLSNCATHG